MYKIILMTLFLFFIGCDNVDNPLTPETHSTTYKTTSFNKNTPIHRNYLDLSINGEEIFYVNELIMPDNPPYVMELEVKAITNSQTQQNINWYTNEEYYITECPDYWDCPIIFDLMQDSTTYTNRLGISTNNILVSPEFAADTLYIYSYFVEENDIYYRDTLKLLLHW